MKTPIGTEVDLGPGHIVLDRDPASPPRKGHSSRAEPPSLFSPCLLWLRSPISATAELLLVTLLVRRLIQRDEVWYDDVRRICPCSPVARPLGCHVQ